MKIGPIHHRMYPSEQTVEQPQPKAANEQRQKDSVDISADGRKKLAELADKEPLKNERELPEKLLKIRNKIEAGYYDLPHVKEEITEALTEEFLNLPNEG